MGAVSTLERLFKYKAWANEELLAAMRRFDDASPAKEIVIRVLNHTYIVDRIFAATMKGTEHGYASANAPRAPALEELSDAIKTSDQWYVDYVSRLDDAQLAESIDFTFTDGKPGRMTREEMLMHVTIHGGGHRGQISWILMTNSVTPPADGLTRYLHEAEASARRRDAAPPAPPIAQRQDQATATKAEEKASLDDLTGRLKTAVGASSSLGKTLKFQLNGDGFIHIDGGSVTNENKDADLTLTITLDDLNAISQGKLGLVPAVVSGRLGVSDMGVALGLQNEMQTLFARMQPAL